MEGLLKKGYSGGEELRRAMAALAGPSASEPETELDSEDASSPRPVPLPVQFTDSTDLNTRELAYAAQRYGKAASRSPLDFDAVYNQGLALQELALRTTSSRQEQLNLLQQAAEGYEAAWKLRPSSHAALYNWGVALSDMARVAKPADPEQAHQYLEESASKYSLSLEWNPNNPQALNNWGLVLQELATMRSPAEQAAQVRQSIAKFRRAIRLRPDFDRACYNLGTVFYAFACTQQSSLTQQLPSHLSQDPERAKAEKSSEAAIARQFAIAAQYIVLAHALQPSKEVYRRSLQVVQTLLPLPYLKAGTLSAPRPETANTSGERWEKLWFVLDDTSFRSSEAPDASSRESEEAQELQPSTSSQRIELEDIVAARTCLDPSLPSGFAFWLGLTSWPSGVYFVAETADEAEGWVDALQLCAHIAALKRLSALRQALQAAPKKTPQKPSNAAGSRRRSAS